MDQQKIGLLLKELRKEKGVTQEQVADQFHVSNRTVSRWETGKNLPDLDVIIEISDYYQVDLREILDGERKNEKMTEETKETVVKAVNYTTTETEKRNKNVIRYLMIGLALFAFSQIVGHTSLVENEIWANVSAFADGLGCGAIILATIFMLRYGVKLQAFKERILSRNK